MPLRILITGASGFVGHWLVALLNRAEPDALLFLWSRGGTGAAGDTRAAPASRVQWQQVDVVRRPEVRAALALARPDEVYHLAGAAHVARSWQDAAAPLMVNAIGTHILFDELRLERSAARMLVAGSSTVYQSSALALTEDSRLQPGSPYGLSKLAQEMVADRAARFDTRHVVVARAFTHIGPGQQPTYFSSAFARQLAAIERGSMAPVLKVGNLEARRDLTDVRDTVRAYHALMKQGTPGRAYNVCSGRAWAIGEVLELLVAQSRARVTVESEPELLRPSDASLSLGSNERICRETGWAPSIPMTQTINDILDSARRRA